MKRIGLILSATLMIVLVAILSGSRVETAFLRVRDGSSLSFKKMIEESSKARIIVIGEVHDVPEHHELELDVMRAFHEADIPLVVGMEMFRTDNQKTLDAWSSGSLPRPRFIQAYYDNWTEPWPLYRDLFDYAREHRIPLLGLNISDDLASTVARHGFASLSAKQKEKLPPGISCNIDPTYRAFIKKAFANHGKPDDKRFTNFCEAQMMWDKTMAWHLIKYLDRHPGVTALVFAGVGHSWRHGIPEQIALQSHYSTAVILPFIPGEIDRTTVTPADADYVARPQ